ncbi:MAG: PrsW family intramembrane metalloprotease [Chloroflexi bacterium]|nr:PrsW family intramembrane metalloprotease [Chloroflexota bacterium]
MRQETAPGKDWRIILTLLISALGGFFFIVQAFSLGVLWLISFFNPAGNIVENTTIGLLAWTSVLSALLLTPLVLISVNQLRGKPTSAWPHRHAPLLGKALRWVILIWPVVVFLGWLVAGMEQMAAIFLGPINLLVAGIPILWIFTLAQTGLASGPQIRKWRLFGFSIALVPMLVIIIELLAALFLGGMAAIGLSLRFYANPQLEQQLLLLAEQVTNLGQDLDAIFDAFKPFLLQPGIIFWGLAIFGGVFPIIEELIKPIALWTLAGRKITPQEGFVGGLLCGAGFALMENVLFFTNVFLAEEWLFMAIGRAGTGVLHMLASGILGWGLALAWRDGKWLALGLTTLSAFILHGAWNILAVITGVVPLLILNTEPTLGQSLLFNSPMTLLLVLAVIGLILINTHLRQ